MFQPEVEDIWCSKFLTHQLMTHYTLQWMGICYIYGLSAHSYCGEVTWRSCLTDQRRRRVTEEMQGDRGRCRVTWEILDDREDAGWQGRQDGLMGGGPQCLRTSESEALSLATSFKYPSKVHNEFVTDSISSLCVIKIYFCISNPIFLLKF